MKDYQFAYGKGSVTVPLDAPRPASGAAKTVPFAEGAGRAGAAATVPFEVGDARVGDCLVDLPEASPSVTSGELPGEGPGSPTYTETDKQ